MFRRSLSAAVLALVFVLSGVVGVAPAAVASTGTVADGSAQVNGVVYASVQAGDRTIIGGAFTTAGGLPRANVAAIRADGTVDPSWNPSVGGTVYALEVSDDGSKIFLGGDFTTVGGLARGRLAAVDAMSGALLTGWKAKSNDGAVRALEASAGRLYVGGSFFRLSGLDIKRLAAVNQATGAVDTAFNPIPSGTVRALGASADGQTLYVGGGFTTIAAAARPGIAALNTGTGTATAFAPNEGGVVIALDATPDGSLVFFSSTNNRTFAYDPASSNVPAYRLRTGGDVQAIAATDDEVYIGGHFTTLPEAKLSRWTLASFDPSNGVATPWNPGTGQFTYGVWTITATADFLAIGGDFVRVGGVRHQGFARFPGTP